MEQETVDLVIEHGSVLTMDSDDRLINDGAVAIRGHSIVAVGSAGEISRRYRAAEKLNAVGKVVMPGLVDTYGHAGHGLIKGLYHPAHGWPSGSFYFHATSADWWYAEGLLSAVERVRFGTTIGQTVVGATPARMDSPIFADRLAEAAVQVGLRAVLGVGPPDPLISHLGEPWSGTYWENGQPVTRTFCFEDTVRSSIDVIRRWNHQADERIQIALHYPYLFGRLAAHPRIPFQYRPAEHVPVMIERAEEMKNLADEFELLLHSHAFAGSLSFALQHYGAERVSRLLDGKVALAHCNALGAEEIEVLGSHGTGICVVPFTHENILYGSCPVIELLDAGANVTISTDGTAPYCSYDLFKEISRAIWAQWQRFQDQTVLPPGKALRMVTIDAARALGMDHLVGSLEPGKRADIILVDFNRPHLVPNTNIPRQLAFYTSGSDVDTVIINGQIIMLGRKVLTVDEEEVIAFAREEAARAFARQDLSHFTEMNAAFWQGSRYDG